MKILLPIYVLIGVFAMLLALDITSRKSTPIVPVEITEKLEVQPDYAKFGEPAEPQLYLKIETNSMRHPFTYLHPVDSVDYNRVDRGDWVPMYQEIGPIFDITWKNKIIIEE